MLAASTPQHGIKAQASLDENLDGAVLKSEQVVLSEIAWLQQLASVLVESSTESCVDLQEISRSWTFCRIKNLSCFPLQGPPAYPILVVRAQIVAIALPV